MSWAKFDDRYHDNRKVKRAWKLHRGAVGLHAMAVTYCAMHETDGIVDAEWLEEKAPAKVERDKIIGALVTVGLFVDLGDGRFEVNDFLEYNRSKAASDAERERKATRQQKWRERSRDASTRRDVDASTDASTGRHGDSAPTRPDPTRPTPPLPPRGNRTREVDAFKEDMRAWAEHHFPDLPPLVVAGAVSRIRAARSDVTPERIRAAAVRIDPTLKEEPMADVRPLPERDAA